MLSMKATLGEPSTSVPQSLTDLHVSHVFDVAEQIFLDVQWCHFQVCALCCWGKVGFSCSILGLEVGGMRRDRMDNIIPSSPGPVPAPSAGPRPLSLENSIIPMGQLSQNLNLVLHPCFSCLLFHKINGCGDYLSVQIHGPLGFRKRHWI